MNLRAGSVVITLLAVGVAFAGEETPYEKAIVQMLGSLDEITKKLKTVIDEDSANAAKPELRKSADVWVETRSRAGKLLPPEKAEKDRLEKLYKPKLEDSLRKLKIEVSRVENITGGKDALKEIAAVLQKEEKKSP